MSGAKAPASTASSCSLQHDLEQSAYGRQRFPRRHGAGTPGPEMRARGTWHSQTTDHCWGEKGKEVAGVSFQALPRGPETLHTLGSRACPRAPGRRCFIKCQGSNQEQGVRRGSHAPYAASGVRAGPSASQRAATPEAGTRGGTSTMELRPGCLDHCCLTQWWQGRAKGLRFGELGSTHLGQGWVLP